MTSLPDMQDAEYVDRRFVGWNEHDAVLRAKYFDRCRFESCSLPDLALHDCEFQDCTFADCDLALMSVTDTKFMATTFVSSKLIGIDWTVATWPSLAISDLIGFQRCTLTSSTFQGLSLPDLKLIDCTAQEIDFSDADLRQADFSGSDLSGSTFAGVDLRKANLVSAVGYAIDPRLTKIREASFSLPEVVRLLAPLNIRIVPGDDDSELSE